MYTSAWRSELSSSSFCGDDNSQCTGLGYGSNTASRCSQNILLTPLLLLFIFFNM